MSTADGDVSESVSDTEDSGDVSESLSDIDDAEVERYINTKEAEMFKRVIWELLNKGYKKGTSRKRARIAKEVAAAKKAKKVPTVADNKKRLSSKFNFDALNKLNEELGVDSPGLEEGREANADMQKSNGKTSFGGSHDDELEHENTYSEEAALDDGQGYGDTYFPNYEYDGDNYNEEYDFDEF